VLNWLKIRIIVSNFKTNKMKKLALLSLFLMVTAVSGFAQNKLEKVSLTYGEELPDDKIKIVKIIGEANNRIFALAIKKDDFFIKTFESGSMKQLTSNPIIIPKKDDKEVDFEDIFLLNNNLYAIGSVYIKKDKRFNLVGTKISDEGVLSTNGTILFEAEVAKRTAIGGFYFKQSSDDSKLLVMHTSVYAKEDAVKYEIKMFDDQLNTLFGYTDKVAFDDSKKDYSFYIADFDLNERGDAFMVVNEGFRDSKKKERVEKLEVHAFKSNKGYAKEVINIDIKGKEIINCSMMSTHNGKLQLVGFYSSVRENGKANKELKGIYNATINVDTNVNDNLKFNEFDYATKVKLLGERKAKKGKDVNPLYNIHSIIEKNDGGLIVLSEYQMTYIGQSSGIGPLAFTPITYTRNEIIITSLKPDGSLDWSNVLPKEQTASVTTMSLGFGFISNNGSFTVGGGLAIPLAQMGKGPEYLGAIPIYRNGQLSIMINDNVKNKGVTDIEQIKSLGNYNNAVPAIFEYDEKGNARRIDPEEAIKNELVIRPGVFHRKSNKEYIVYSSRKKMDRLGRMVLED
jgi:hypothetical protein